MYSNQKYHISDSTIEDEYTIIQASLIDPERFGELYERYYESIFRFVYKRVEEKEAAFDITSTVFLNAMLHLKTYNNKGIPFVSWLYRIAYNEIVKACRKKQSIRTTYIHSENIAELLEDIQEENKEAYYLLMTEALGKLEEREIQFIELRYFEKKSFKEVGEILGINENNAKVKFHRIITKIKNNLNLKR